MKELSLHITDLCNFRCAFCVWGETLLPRGERILLEDLEGFLRAHRGQGFERVNLHGGEPTLRRDLLPLLGRIRELGYPSVSLQTNGWRLADRAFVESLVRAGVSAFIISVHGHTPEMQDGLAGARGSLHRLLRGMANVRALGGRIQTNTVVTRLNHRHLPEIAALVLAAGASHVNLSALMPSGRALIGGPALMPTYAEVLPSLRQAVSVADREGATVTLEGFPGCAVPGLEDRCLFRDLATGQQVKCLVRGQVWTNHDDFLKDNGKTKRAACASCRLGPRCPGVYTLYVRKHGWSEFPPVTRRAGREPREASHASR